MTWMDSHSKRCLLLDDDPPKRAHQLPHLPSEFPAAHQSCWPPSSSWILPLQSLVAPPFFPRFPLALQSRRKSNSDQLQPDAGWPTIPIRQGSCCNSPLQHPPAARRLVPQRPLFLLLQAPVEFRPSRLFSAVRHRSLLLLAPAQLPLLPAFQQVCQWLPGL